MTAINSISRSAIRVDYDIDASSMTPQDLIAYCRTRLSQLQEDIRQRSDKQQKMSRSSEILADVGRKLGEATGAGTGNLTALDVAKVRDAFRDAAAQIADLGPEMQNLANRVLESVSGFDEKCHRTVHFSDGTTYELNASEKDEMAIERHDAWVRWNASGQRKPDVTRIVGGDPNGGLAEDAARDAWLAGAWEGDVLDHRDGQTAESAGKVPQANGTLTSVTYHDNTTTQKQVENLRENLKNTQGILNENSQTGLDELRNLTQQKQQALQMMQQMLQALQDQAKATQEWR